jgi:soluble lytic murein transglycosylase-like protein/Tfp pilus assembly protein PilF
MLVTVRTIVLLALLAPGAAHTATLPPLDLGLPTLEVAGATELRAGDSRAALAVLDSVKTYRDTTYYRFKRGLALFGGGDYEQALPELHAAARSSLLAATAWDYIGRIYQARELPDSALSAYHSALDGPVPEHYQTELRNAVTTVVMHNGINPAEHAWLATWFKAAPLVDDTAQAQAVRRVMATAAWPALDSIVALLLDSSASSDACRLLVRLPLDSIPDSVLSTARLFDAANTLFTCGRYAEARPWLARMMQRRDAAAQVQPKRSLYLQGMLAYRLGEFDDAVTLLRRFDRQYGPTAEQVLTVARCYRALDRDKKASEWYDRHIALFPNNIQTQEILWYRAWQREDAHQYGRAIELYRRLRQQYRSGARAPDALFREGLLWFRLDSFDSALVAWTQLLRSYPQSSQASAARYWEARALLGLRRSEEAHAALVETLNNDPLDYYGYRAVDALRQMGDTTTDVSIQTAPGVEATRVWLDTVAPADTSAIPPSDSLAYRSGALLAVVGLTRQAEYYLEPLIRRYPTRLLFQFDVAMLYAQCGFPTLAYKAARSLAWRIPPERRTRMPLTLHGVLYPSAYRDVVQQEASRRGVEPSLISAIIRQESMFDPAVISPAGAIGLMQIMPATAAKLAAELAEPYAPDSLYSPTANIRYGTHYVRQLLEQFSGNIVLALAGYNGGPHNAMHWYECNHDDGFDLFIENIAFTETRGYVRRVLANYWTYNRLARLGSAVNLSPLR